MLAGLAEDESMTAPPPADGKPPAPPVPPPHDRAPSLGHDDAREQALASLGDAISAQTAATVRRMHVSGEPGYEGWLSIAKQVESIARHNERITPTDFRKTVKEGK
jgi:hypothetical protein